MEQLQQTPMSAGRWRNQLRHSGWTLLAPLVPIIIGTFNGAFVRGLCLICAGGITIWIICDSPLAKGTPQAQVGKFDRILRTLVAAIVVIAVGYAIFRASNRIEAWTAAPLPAVAPAATRLSNSAPSQSTQQAPQSSSPPPSSPAQSPAAENTQPPVQTKHHRLKKAAGTSTSVPTSTAPATPQSMPAMSQECGPGANCGMSTGQTGGITAGQVGPIIVNPQAPPPHVKWSEKLLHAGIDAWKNFPGWGMGGSSDQQEDAEMRAEFVKNPGTFVTFSADDSWTEFAAECDRPCKSISARFVEGSGSSVGQGEHNDTTPILQCSIPTILPAAHLIRWEIRSKDQQPVHINRVIAVRLKYVPPS